MPTVNGALYVVESYSGVLNESTMPKTVLHEDRSVFHVCLELEAYLLDLKLL